ncbi:MAG: hypothetical protein C4331_10220 [Meiothermus sp.]
MRSDERLAMSHEPGTPKAQSLKLKAKYLTSSEGILGLIVPFQTEIVFLSFRPSALGSSLL